MTQALNLDTTNIETGEIFHRMSDEAMIDYFAIQQEANRLAQFHLGHIEMELMRRATESGATVIQGNGMKYEIKTPNEYDRSQLPALVEFLTPEQKTKCVVPAHMKEIPESHDMQQWNKAARENGGDLADGIKGLTFPGKASGKLVQTES